MRTGKILTFIILVLLLSVSALAEKGPVPDKVYFDVRMNEDIAIRDVAEGKSDIFYYGIDYPRLLGLDQKILNNLEIYHSPAGTWSIQFNPYPNEKPYTFELDGKTIFNPFAIREIRFAMNFLINRQYVIDEILNGGGGHMFSVATPGQPGTYKYNLISAKFGFTPEGDEERALADIEAAMKKASQLPENKGKLKKEGKWWTYNGEPVTVKFFIRVDDPNGRMKLGEYMTQQIEKAGIKVEKLLWDRSKTWGVVYGGNPEKWEYTIYTEGWSAGATRKYWEHIVAQMYAPWYGYMPGGYGDGWKYKHDLLDELTQKAYNGKYMTEDEYWDLTLRAQEIGLKESVRIYIAYQNSYYVANKDRFNKRFAYGLGDGLSKYTLVTADTKDGIVRATQYSAKGSLFMSAWDPVGPDGFSDTYSEYIAAPLYDPPVFESPSTADTTFCRAYPIEVVSKPKRAEDGSITGEIEVPADAKLYDPVKEEWVEIGEGKTAISKGVYGLRLGKYHHGIPISLVDYLYADAFVEEWIKEDFEDDPYYSEGYEAYMGGMDTSVATVYDFENEQVISYFDYHFPGDKNRVAYRGAPSWSVSPDPSIGVAWEIVEAMARMVVDGGASGKNYVFAQGIEGAYEVDAIRPSCVADIRAELEEMIAEKHVPVSIKDFITPGEAVERYQAAIDFIDKYGHAYISNGPFYMSDIDYDANFVELSAFRDESYPFEPGYWMEALKSVRLSIERVGVPVMVEKGEQVLITANVSETVYPNDESNPASTGNVKVILVTNEGEKEFEAEAVKDGVFRAVIPGDVTAELEPGSYTVVTIAEAENALPSTKSSSIVIY